MSDRNMLGERLEFIGMDPDTQEILRKLKPFIERSIGPALTKFYQRVRATPKTRQFFRDESHIQHAQSHQERHWQIIAEADYGDAYARGVRAIGQAHARLGLEPRWYIGGYALVSEQLIRALVAESWPGLLARPRGGAKEAADKLASLIKAVMIDMDLAISIYLDALAEERSRLEAAREATQRNQTEAVQALGDALRRLADGDLTTRVAVEVAPEFASLKSDFNASIEALQKALLAVQASSGAISGSTEEIASAADDLSRRTENQAASLEQAAASLDQITATVKNTAGGADEARHLVAETKIDAEKSEEVVRRAIEAMSGIEKSSKQIHQIIGVIDEIAFQTNLLALNAGVEAARAGEAGRGFAVVASEVRALAQRSAEAAKEIKTLISTSAAQVEEGVELVVGTGRALEGIVVKVADISNVVSRIAASAQEQSAGLGQVNTAVNQMDQVTQQNATMVEETTAAVHSLTSETAELRRLVAAFQVGERPANVARKPTTHATRSAARPRSVSGGLALRKAAPAAVGAADNWEEF